MNQCWPDSLTHICSTRGDELIAITPLYWGHTYTTEPCSHAAPMYRYLQCPKPQIYFPWRTQHENTYPCFCILPPEFGVNIDILKHENNEVLCSNRNKSPRKCLGTPNCKYMENMLVDFIWLNVQAKYLEQTILYHFKWDMALWKWPKCPQCMQRTWWQTVATQHTGLTWLKMPCLGTKSMGGVKR